jgi:AcrR family transcriptional regulator
VAGSHEAGRDPGRSTREADDRRERILNAAERLFADRGFRNVAVRDIAGEAGVTHPLIYYYWSSREDLLAAVMERTQSRIRRAARSDDALELLAAIARDHLQGDRHYLLTITRALLDGMSPAEWPGGFPGVEAMLASPESKARLEAGGDAAVAVRERIAVLTAMLSGWVLLEDQLLEITGLSPADRDHARETLVQCMRAVLAPVVGGA